jgi:hypothetical protein
MDRAQVVAWHAVASDEALRLLDSNARSGLGAGDVSRRLEGFGYNRLPEASKTGH